MKILVVAGEASADLHAGHLIKELQKKHTIELIGIGGDTLISCGLKPIKTPREMAVVGLVEALKKIPQTLKLLRELESLAKKEKPDFALLLDLPDFNLRLAPKLKNIGVPVIYYISPQVWAWRSSRVFAMAECIDLLMAILPFEKAWYQKNAPEKLQVKYVGHPVIEEIPNLPYAPEENHLVLMPGSRESEWKGLFGVMVEAASILSQKNPELRFSLPLASTLRESEVVKEYLDKNGPFSKSLNILGDKLQIIKSPAHEVLRKAKAAWIASGTATLEAGIVGIPMIVVYKVAPLTAFLFRHLIKYSGAIAIVNLIHKGLGANEKVVTEILQEEVQPEILANAMSELLASEAWLKQKNILAQTRTILSGSGNPVQNAAIAIEEFISARQS